MKQYRVQTIAIEPSSGTSKSNGACRLAYVDIFLPDTGLTLRGLELSYDVDDGWRVYSPTPKQGLRQFTWKAGSSFDVAVTASASEAYMALGNEEIENLRGRYRALAAA